MSRDRCSATPDPQEELQQHIRALGLNSIDDYREWCARHGFNRKLDKGPTARAREREVVLRGQAAIRSAEQSRRQREHRRPADVVRAICRNELTEADLATPYLQRFLKIQHALCPMSRRFGSPREALRKLVEHTAAVRAEFFDGSLLSGAGPGDAPQTYVEALPLLATVSAHWIRPLQEWRPRSHSAARQFASLLRHLFVRYDDVPLFLDTAWFRGADATSRRYREWYLHVGRGENIRHCDLPIPYTKRMAHHFLRAPDDVTIEQALRWGQVLGLGGNEPLARALFGTRLGDQFEHEEFWETVIRWLIANPLFDREQIGPIVDYLHHQRFVPEIGAARGPGVLAPAQPNLSMKGRSPEVLLRQVHAWHRQLTRHNAFLPRQWSPCGIRAFEFVEGLRANGSLRVWTIRELLSGQALQSEGRQLRHCVASYAHSCARGTASIWTLELEVQTGLEKRLTIEVRTGTRQICQARGQMNRMPTEQEHQVLRRWATEAGLSIARHVE